MGRGRGKGKKQTVIDEDPGNGEEDKVPAYRRRGRLVKPLEDDNEEEEAAEIKQDGKDVQDSISSKDVKSQAATKNGQKRKRPEQTKENTDLVKEENGIRTKLSTDNSTMIWGSNKTGEGEKTSLDKLLKLSLSACDGQLCCFGRRSMLATASLLPS